MSPYLSQLPYVRAHRFGCDCAGRAGEQLGAELPTAPDGPPAGPWLGLEAPPARAVAAVRSQAAEVFRRAVWSAAGAPGWDADARIAWTRIATLPAMPDASAMPGQVVLPVATWFRHAIGLVPSTWAQAGDPRAAAVGALSTFAARVIEQLDTRNPLVLYDVGQAWRSQAVADRAAGLFEQARELARATGGAVLDTIRDSATGIGFGAVLGVGALLAVGAVLLAPEAATAAAYRAGRGVRKQIGRESGR